MLLHNHQPGTREGEEGSYVWYREGGQEHPFWQKLTVVLNE